MAVPVDISAILGGGAYVLRHRGTVVYVGKSTVLLTKLAGHRNGARRKVATWSPVPGIVFDSVEIYPEHPDRVDALVEELTLRYSPRAIQPAFLPPAPPTITRRV